MWIVPTLLSLIVNSAQPTFLTVALDPLHILIIGVKEIYLQIQNVLSAKETVGHQNVSLVYAVNGAEPP